MILSRLSLCVGGGGRPPSPTLALCVYNMQTVSTRSRLHQFGADSVYRLQAALPITMGKRCQRAFGKLLNRLFFCGGPCCGFWHDVLEVCTCRKASSCVMAFGPL